MTVRVLMVDDDPADALLVSELLLEVDDPPHVVTHLRSLDALAEAVANGVEADVVLLDLAMPGTRGTPTVRRAVAIVGDVPIVVHSSHHDRAVALEAVHAGAEDYLVKGAGTGDDVARVLANARERHRGRRALADALEQVGRANEELVRLQRAQDEFVAIASHELRTPVTVASGFVRLLTDHGHTLDAEQRRDLLRRTNAAMGRLQALTDDLLAVSRAGHGRVDPRTAAVSLREAVTEAATGSAVEEGELRVDVPAGLVVVADRVQLTRVVRNLLDNAVRHGAPPVEVVGRGGRERVTLRVSDHGPGVPPAFVPAMFDRFTQADASASRSAEGTGLGLSIVRSLVEAVGGRVEYESTPAGGACVVVELSRARVPAGSTDGIGGVLGGQLHPVREAVHAGREP